MRLLIESTIRPDNLMEQCEAPGERRTDEAGLYTRSEHMLKHGI